MALETKPAKDPAAEDKHELDPKRKAALDTALAQVEKSFGKGSAMRLGDTARAERRGDSHRFVGSRYGARHRRPTQGPHRGDLRPRIIR